MKRYKKIKYGRESKRERFISLSYPLLDSLAWRHLTNADKAAFISLKRRFNGMNNDSISLSVREIAAENKMSINTASKSLKHLQQKGLISLTKYGYFGSHMASTWKLNTDSNPGYHPSNEWKQWKPGDDFTNGIPVAKENQTVAKEDT